MKTARVTLKAKEPDAFGFVIDELGLSEDERKRFFEFCEYATLDLTLCATRDSKGKLTGLTIAGKVKELR